MLGTPSRSPRSAVALIAFALAPLTACGDGNGNGTDETPGYIACEYEETRLYWTDKAPEHESFDALMRRLGRVFSDAIINDAAGVVTIEKDNRPPIHFANTAGGCPDYTEVPILLTLEQGAHSSPQKLKLRWEDQAAWTVETPVYDRPSLLDFEPLPPLDGNQRELGVRINLKISLGDGQVVGEGLFSIITETEGGSGPDGSLSMHFEPWFAFSFDGPGQ